jgi:hypothetical protein
VCTLTLYVCKYCTYLNLFLIQDKGEERVPGRFFLGPGDWTSLTSFFGLACMLPTSRKFGGLTQERPSKKVSYRTNRRPNLDQIFSEKGRIYKQLREWKFPWTLAHSTVLELA